MASNSPRGSGAVLAALEIEKALLTDMWGMCEGLDGLGWVWGVRVANGRLGHASHAFAHLGVYGAYSPTRLCHTHLHMAQPCVSEGGTGATWPFSLPSGATHAMQATYHHSDETIGVLPMPQLKMTMTRAVATFCLTIF